MLSVLLRFTDSDYRYPFWYLQTHLTHDKQSGISAYQHKDTLYIHDNNSNNSTCMCKPLYLMEVYVYIHDNNNNNSTCMCKPLYLMEVYAREKRVVGINIFIHDKLV